MMMIMMFDTERKTLERCIHSPERYVWALLFIPFIVLANQGSSNIYEVETVCERPCALYVSLLRSKGMIVRHFRIC